MRTVTVNEWQQFVLKGVEPLGAERALAAWSEARAAGVDPYRHALLCSEEGLPTCDSKGTVADLRKLLANSLKPLGSLAAAWFYTDAGGVVQEVEATSSVFGESLVAVGFSRGARLDLASAGSNAVATSMHSQKAACCNGAEHYLQILHHVSTAAVPFYEIDGSLRAYVGLLSPYPETDGHFLLAILGALILVVDRDIRLRRSKASANQLKETFSFLFENDSNPCLLVTRSGFLRQANPAAIRMFSLDGDSVEERSVDKLVDFEPGIRDVARSAIPCRNSPMRIRLRNRVLHVAFDKTPVYSEKDEFLGVLISFRSKSEKPEKPHSPLAVAKYTFKDILGQTPAILRAKELAGRVAATAVNVFLTGESGTGKEMFAQSIHNASDRKNEPFISINCAAIPRDIAESELFGYGAGAFTGASRHGNMGKLESANLGTVFLDEIGDMPLDLQSKLLRVLESRTITRIGESKERPINIRVIAATNKDVQELVRAGQFREDLYYRISVTSINLPPLRDSRDDIPELTGNFIEYFNEVMGKRIRGIQDEIMRKFKEHPWPGNIRELRNAIEFAVMLNNGEDLIAWEDLPGQLRMDLLYSQSDEAVRERSRDPLYEQRQSIEQSERILYRKAIEMANGNMSRAAKILNVGRATLYRKLKQYKILNRS